MLAPGLLLADPVAPDLFGIGLVMAIVGSFLLANSILFRHPRTMVEEHFGGRGQRLTSIREYIFHRVQVHLGFFFLLVGFGLQLYGHFRPVERAPGAGGFPVAWIGAILLAVVVLELVGWWLSHWLFRRYVRAYFSENPPELETNMRLARELGDLFNIATSGDDTVPSYLAQIRRHLGLPAGRREARREPRVDDDHQRTLRDSSDDLLGVGETEPEREEKQVS